MYCKNCHYSLRLLKSESCPECGKPFDAENSSTYIGSLELRRYRKMLSVLVLSSVLSTGFAFLILVASPIEASSIDGLWEVLILGSIAFTGLSYLSLNAYVFWIVYIGDRSIIHPGVYVWLFVIDVGSITCMTGLLMFLFP